MSGTKTCQGAAWARCNDALHPLAACGSLIKRGPAHSRCPLRVAYAPNSEMGDENIRLWCCYRTRR